MAAAESSTKPEGIAWPISSSGKVSTTEVSKRIWCACVEGMMNEEGSEREKCESLISRIQTEKDWRHKYTHYIGELTVLMAGSARSAVAQSTSGLKAIYSEFSFTRGDLTSNVIDAIAGKTDMVIEDVSTKTTQGTGSVADHISVPVKINGNYQSLTGDALVKQAEAWAEYGCCEATVAASIKSVASLKSSELPLTNRIFCMLGGTSELCPSRPLLSLGATVAVIARPGEKLDSLIEYASTTQGTLLLPQLAQAQKPGLDLLTHTPEVAKWLRSVSEYKSAEISEPKLCVGSYIYLDGERHVRASVAMDAICTSLADQLGPERVELTQLASPATAHLWPSDAVRDAETRWQNRSWRARLARFETNTGPRVGVSDVTDRKVFNGTLVVQGPNYALAKILQLWRCVLARQNGQIVSANFAPPARTDSVMHAPSMTAALNGMQAMEPLAVLDAPTACSFMTALLLSDLLASTNNSSMRSNPADPNVKLDHPWDLFTYNAFHGGNWRCAYHQESIGTAAFVLGTMNYETGTAGVKK